jgi:gliding motility-associated-like protein
MKDFKHIILLLVIICFHFSAYPQLQFIQNKGQWPDVVDFKADIAAGAFYLGKTGFTVLLQNAEDLQKLHARFHGPFKEAVNPDEEIVVRSFAYKVSLEGANPEIKLQPEKLQKNYNNYYLGSDSRKWASNCSIHEAVLYKDVYPGIDMRYYSDAGNLKYDFIIYPGADAGKIQLNYEGPSSLGVRDGNLIIGTSLGEVKELYPYSYQPSEEGRKTVKAEFSVRDNVVGFHLENYDPKKILIIDPTVIFSTFTGSTSDNWGFTATPGEDGSFYSGGIVFGTGYPVSLGAFQSTFRGGASNELGNGYDIGIFKFSADGQNRLYATYLGGSGNEQPHSMIVDNNGNLVVAGRSNSSNFPLEGPLKNIGPGGQYDIIISKFNGAGTALLGSVQIGGSANDGVNTYRNYFNPGPTGLRRNYGDDARSEVILDNAGNIILASCTQSRDFPLKSSNLNPGGGYGGGDQDGVVLKFNQDLSAQFFSSYFGGTSNDACFVASIHPATGMIYIGGSTMSNDLPGNFSTVMSTGNAFQGGITDGYVTQVRPDGSGILNTVYLGTSGLDMLYGLKFDQAGFPYVMGTTLGNWPVIKATYSNPGSRQFIAKLQPDFSNFVYSTVFGSGASPGQNISPVAFLVDRCQNVYVSGWGGQINNDDGYSSSDTRGLPKVNPLPTSFAPDDGSDFYLFVLERDAKSQLFGSHFGQVGGAGEHVDGGTSRFDENGIIYQAMCANCGSPASRGTFPTTPAVWSPINRSDNCNLAAVKIQMNFAGIQSGLQSTINKVKGNTKGCAPLFVTFGDTLAKGVKYYWNHGNGIQRVTTVPIDTGTYTQAGTYVVTLITEDSSTCNIRDTSYITIEVGIIEAYLDFIFKKLSPCKDFKFDFTNLSFSNLQSMNGVLFTWNFGDGSPSVTTSFNAPVVHSFPGPGEYEVSLRLNDSSFCNVPLEIVKTVKVIDLVNADFKMPDSICLGEEVVFENTSTGGVTFKWEFGDGSTSSSSSQFVSHKYITAGTFAVRLIAIDSNTCNIIDTSEFQYIVVSDTPVAAFDWLPKVPEENKPVRFINGSSGATRYLWDFGEGETSTLENPEYIFNSSGKRIVMLVAFNADGCTDTAYVEVEAKIRPLLDVPNAFTPGKFGVNSQVKVEGFGISRMKWQIYNRWGQLVFESNSPKSGWDGTFKGKPQPMEVYTYVLDAQLTDGNKIKKTGDITLIR